MKYASYLIILFLGFVYSTTQAQTSETVISIPTIGVNATIVEAPLSQELQTWDVSGLNMTVGHLQHTAWFGEANNILLAGHSENIQGQADIFYNLDALEPGDEIIVQSAGQTYRYIVQRVDNVASTDLSILYETEVETLTLFTCDISSYAGDFTYTRRHVIVAERSFE